MRVLSVSPLVAGSVIWQPARSSYALTVVAKATFRLLPGEAVLAEDQEFVNEEANHWNDDPARSLYAPCDIVPRKKGVDVLLVGHAFAPGGDPVRALRARLDVGAIGKEIEVLADRTLTPDGRVVEGAPFAKMQLRYERAAGGPETDNPVGVRTGLGVGLRAQRTGPVPLPNLMPPRSASSPDDVIPPVAFGPIAERWPTRTRLLGPAHAAVADGGWRTGPVPEGLDFAYFNAAPPDQQLDRISDTERIALLHLHPELELLVTRLPGLRPRAYVERPRAGLADVPMTADTLWIDTDRAACTVTWRGQVDLASPQEPGRVLVAMEQGSQRLDPEEVAALAPPPEPEAPPSVHTQPLLEGAPADTGSFRARPRTTTLPVLGTRPPGAVPFQLGAPGAPPPATRPKSITLSGQEVSTKGGGAPAWLAAAPPPSPPRPVTPALDATELLWFAPAAVPEIRRTFRPLLVASGLDGADAPDGTPADDLLCVLGAGQPLDAAELEEALEDGIGPNGQFRAPLVLVRGALRFPLDPAAAQKAREALGWSSLGLRPAKPGSAPNPAQAADEAEIDRHLLLRRCYERRTVLGEDQIRALLSPAGSQAAVPAYLPVAAAKVLPLFPSIPVRLIAEARPQQDCFEDHPVALRVVALGWDISVRART